MTITRRTLLGSAGRALALPWLASLRGPGGAPARPTRALFVFAPNGQHMPDWTPASEGADFTLPHLLEPLEGHRRQLLVISGLALDAARAHGDGPGDHARASATFLTCTHPLKSGGRTRVGVSVDQLIAAKAGLETRFPSIELGCESGRQAGDCDSGYSCAYTNNVSWRTPESPATKEVHPAAAFARIFGGPDEHLAPEVRDRRRRDRRSVLDFVLDEARALSAALDSGDRHKLDEYMASVREVERRIHSAESRPALPGDAIRARIPEDFREHLRIMYDLIALAFQSDVTRVATLMVGNEASNRSYPFLDVPDGHHHLSHHGRDPEKIAKIRKINRFHVEELARFLAKLGSTADGDATLLDRSMVLYGSGIADGDRHDHHDLPILVAGGGNGTVRGGRHLRCPGRTPLANLHLALLDRMGVRAACFGDSAGRLADL